MKEPTSDRQPAGVGGKGVSPAFPKQAGEARDPKNWVERSVWTERMLERLAQSQEQTVWYSLWDKVWQAENARSIRTAALQSLQQSALRQVEHPKQHMFSADEIVAPA